MTEQSYKQLNGSRTAFAKQITNFESFIEDIANIQISNENVENLKSRLQKLEDNFSKFEDYQTAIEVMSENVEEEYKRREDYESRFFHLVGQARNFIKMFNNNPETSSTSIQSSNNSISQQNIRLPSIELPSFDGNITEWRAFEDTFLALIDRNESLNNVQKLCYLKLALKGEAASIIQSLKTTDANYQIALKLVSERYCHHRRIIYSHVNSLLNLKTMSLKSFINIFEQHIRSLESLLIPVKQWDAFLIPLIVSKLETKIAREWEARISSTLNKDELPTYDSILSFLLEKLDTVTSSNISNVYQNLKTNIKSFATMGQVKNCVICNENHQIYSCKKFLNQAIFDRIKSVKAARLCLNCLRPGHMIKECQASKCKECGEKHNSLLHLRKSANTTNSDKTRDPQTTSITNCATKTNFVQTLLSTAEVYISDINNKFHKARVLLDSASQSNFITNSFCNKLRLAKHNTNMTIFGINHRETNIKHCVNVKMQSKDYNFKTNLSCLIMNKITENLPATSFEKECLSIPDNITLADDEFNISKPIDLLIGVKTFWDIITPEKFVLENKSPIFQKTQLGWIVAGQIPFKIQSQKLVNYHSRETELDIERLWKLDEFSPDIKFLSKEDQICENHFNATIKRNVQGKFIVNIPFKETISLLGDSRFLAIKRFYNLERKLSSDTGIYKQYSEFLSEYENLNHMTKIPDNQYKSENVFYLPHHHVIRDSSTTTKLRVVFDGSMKTTTGTSLNENQYTGPSLQTDIFSLLVRFRLHNYVVTADINKMYRQILIEPTQRKFQQIFWRDNPNKKLNTYELNTVTYGTASAPYLAIRCLIQLAKENEKSYPKESNLIKTDFYVDDLLTGTDNINDLKTICHNIYSILNSAGFELRKWMSNTPQLASDVIKLENKTFNLQDKSSCKTLGISFDSSVDIFYFSLLDKNVNKIITKRTILSKAARIFDPLGLLSPITVTPKIILQELWKLKLNWDQQVPPTIENKWKCFQNNCNEIDSIPIPRHCLFKSADKFHLHGFSDASNTAYGACVYIKSLIGNTTMNVQLIAAKSRVAPVKTITVPRLELCAAALLAKLANQINKITNISFDEKYFWSDSTVTLAWINSCPSTLKTFVANRVSSIQNLTSKEQWHHIRSNVNPADAISRGMLPEKLKSHDIWWHGPHFIRNNFSKSNYTFNQININEIPEQRLITMTTIISPKFDLFSKFSSLTKLINVMSYILRFANNCKTKNRTFVNLSQLERKRALEMLIKITQREVFSSEIKDIQKKRPISAHSNILLLNPFIDNVELLRVGGRLQNTELTFEEKHPIILPYKHALTNLIVRNEHEKYLHCGPLQLLYLLRQKYWPIKGKSITKSIVHKCVKCYKIKPQPLNQIMGQLPSFRVRSSHPFLFTGVDYAGPFLSRDKRSRGYKSFKVYVCLFVCLSTKAIHIEIVEGLSSDAFLSAFRRFVSRRGRPKEMYSDNGTNFVGANKELNRLQQIVKSENETIIKNLERDGTFVKWNFIPPRAPHFGGLWEASIKLVKRALAKAVGNSILTFGELYTILTQIEAMVNSRPISPISDHPNDLLPLSPAHLLIGRNYIAVPDEDLQLIKDNRLSIYQHLQKLTQTFWKRWQHEYLQQLQGRNKWKKENNASPTVGDLVILVNDNEPPNVWSMARITELHPGTDGKVRVVSVFTTKGIFKRPITKICMLPISNDNKEAK